MILLVVVSCAPEQPLTDEELEAELAKLTPEERGALLKDLESKEKSAFAGQAIASKYQISSRALRAPLTKVQDAVNILNGPCVDSDGQDAGFIKGVTKGKVSWDPNPFYELWDTCIADSNPYDGYYKKVSECSKEDMILGCWVGEAHCYESSQPTVGFIHAPNGCKDGAFLPS